MGEKAIKTENLTKIYKLKKKKIKANLDVTLSVSRGEIFSILGPNGAGKTTFVKILSTLVLPTSGKAFVNGFDVVKNEREARRCIGLSTGFERSFYYRLTGFQNLHFFGTLYGLSEKKLAKRIAYLLEIFGLNKARDMKYMKYSTGMKKKLSLVRAFLHDPDIYIFDEPTASIDPESAQKIRDIIKLLKTSNKTVILTTHNLHEAEDLSDRIAILGKGKLLAIDTPGNLKKHLRHNIIRMKLDRELDEDFFLLNGLKSQIKHIEIDNSSVLIQVEDASFVLNDILKKLNEAKVRLLNVTVEEPSLEEVFLNLVGEEEN